MKNTENKEFVIGSNEDIDIKITKHAVEIAHKRIDEAIKQYEGLDEEDLSKEDIYLRIGVTGGGCSGFKYDILTEAGCNEETCAVSTFDGINIAIDFITYPYLEGAHVEFVESPIVKGAGNFHITNPQWKDTCSCGQSFTV